MIRNGATDNVLAYLSSSDILRLRNISAGHWEGALRPYFWLVLPLQVRFAERPLQDIMPLRTFRTMPRISTPEYERIATSSMMPYEYSRRIIEI